MRTRPRILILIGFIVAALLSAHGLDALSQERPSAAVSNVPTNSPLKEVGPGEFVLGKVRLNKRQKAVSFPAVLNMSDHLIEYLVVTDNGKTHESLLRTDAEPYHIHAAMLLLGAKGAGTNSFPQSVDQPLPGENVLIEVSWKTGGRERSYRAEELIHNRLSGSVMSKGPWTYNGSRLEEGMFLAQQDGSVVSLIEDPHALVNNPRPGRENDEAWEVRRLSFPPLNSPVQVTLRLESGL